ncbi:MAG: DUF2167 domain-containing protein [Steroidobacteraceae bacterium]
MKHPLSVAAAVVLVLGGAPLLAQQPAPADAVAAEQEPARTPEQQAYLKAESELNWVKGPSTATVAGNSKLVVPEGYVFLDAANTDKFLLLNQNIPGGKEVMIAPADLEWSAYLSFSDEGYVKDDEKIDADELLKAMKQGTEDANQERRRRGWDELHVLGWAVPPAYNSANKRLEWATILQGRSGRGVNFSTKVLGRSGHTSVILVSSEEGLSAARPKLEQVLAGYSFNQGHRYADWVPGDKVAEYGLAALVLGGAAAIATKKGFWAILGTFFAAAWKLIAAGLVALVAGIRKFFGRKTQG